MRLHLLLVVNSGLLQRTVPTWLILLALDSMSLLALTTNVLPSVPLGKTDLHPGVGLVN